MASRGSAWPQTGQKDTKTEFCWFCGRFQVDRLVYLVVIDPIQSQTLPCDPDIAVLGPQRKLLVCLDLGLGLGQRWPGEAGGCMGETSNFCPTCSPVSTAVQCPCTADQPLLFTSYLGTLVGAWCCIFSEDWCFDHSWTVLTSLCFFHVGATRSETCPPPPLWIPTEGSNTGWPRVQGDQRESAQKPEG